MNNYKVSPLILNHSIKFSSFQVKCEFERLEFCLETQLIKKLEIYFLMTTKNLITYLLSAGT